MKREYYSRIVKRIALCIIVELFIARFSFRQMAPTVNFKAFIHNMFPFQMICVYGYADVFYI